MSDFHLMPPSASSIASSVDAVFWTWTVLCAIVAIAVFATMIGFAIHFRRGRDTVRTLDTTKEHHGIEFTWIVVPLIIFLGMFFWAANLYAKLFAPPPDAIRISIVAKQWMWKAEHASGQREIDELHVPVGRPIELVMTSEDVIHSFFVPAFRIKRDVVPGRYSDIWFQATEIGSYHLFCSEFCGTDHARMGGTVVVMTPERFAAWLEQEGVVGMAERGAGTYRRLGCGGCHDGSGTVHAPRLAGIYGQPVPLSDGQVAFVDDRYLHDAIVLPAKEVAAGYDAIMPSYQGQVGEEDILDLIAYIKSLPKSP